MPNDAYYAPLYEKAETLEKLLQELVDKQYDYLNFDYSPENGVDDFLERVEKALKK